MVALTLNLSACGLKGKLKSPSQIAREEAKKQEKAKEDNSSAAVPPTTGIDAGPGEVKTNPATSTLPSPPPKGIGTGQE